jgi:hypothetical protein
MKIRFHDDHAVFLENGNGTVEFDSKDHFLASVFAVLNQKKYVLIMASEIDYDLKSLTKHHFIINNEIIFMNFSIRNKLKNFNCHEIRSLSYESLASFFKQALHST